MPLKFRAAIFLVFSAVLLCPPLPPPRLSLAQDSSSENTVEPVNASPQPAANQPGVPRVEPPAAPDRQQAGDKEAGNNKKKAEVFYGIGLRYFKQKNYKEAWVAFNNVAQLYPHYKDLDSYLDLTQKKLSEAQKKELESKKEFYSGVQEKYIKNLYADGLYAMRYQRYQDAINRFDEVLELDGQHQGARQRLVQARILLQRQLRDITQRGTEFVKGEQKAKDELINTAVQMQLASVYQEAIWLLKNNWPEKALKKFEEIYAADPEYRDVARRLADLRILLLAENRRDDGPPYELGAEDVIGINVLNHPELSGLAMVEQGGEIVLPLVREVLDINGLSAQEAAQKIRTVLVKYVQEPEVQVVITEYNSKKWYILGEVGLRGEYPLGRKKLTLMEALYQAGLPLEQTSAMWRVEVIKPHKTKPYRRWINVADIIYKGRTQDNVIIEPGNIIYIPQTVLQKVTVMLNRVADPITILKTGFQDLYDASTAARNSFPLSEIFGKRKKTSTTN